MGSLYTAHVRGAYSLCHKGRPAGLAFITHTPLLRADMMKPPSLVCSEVWPPPSVGTYVRSQVGPTALAASTGRAITNGEKTTISRIVATTTGMKAINTASTYKNAGRFRYVLLGPRSDFCLRYRGQWARCRGLDSQSTIGGRVLLEIL